MEKFVASCRDQRRRKNIEIERRFERWRIPKAPISFTAAYRASARKNLQQFLSFRVILKHPDLYPSRITKDQNDVRAIKSIITSTFINPFEGKELISLTSGLSPSDEVISDLLSAKSKGESALKEFVQERLVDQRIGFFKPLSRLNLDSFTKLKTTEVKWFNSVSKALSLVKLQ